MQIPKVVLDVLNAVAPTLATALGGPLAGAAAGVALKALNQWMGNNVSERIITPTEIVSVVQANKDNEKFLLDLRKAELDIQKYEMDLDFRFADLVVKDKQSSRDFQRDSDIAGPLMRRGMAIVTFAMAALMAVVLGSLFLIAGVLRLPPETAQMAVGVFGLIGAITGYIASYGTQVLGFYYGSSAGSKSKDEALSAALVSSGEQLGEAIKTAPARVSRETPPAPPPQVIVVPSGPVTPPPVEPAWRRGPFGGVRWHVQADGLLVEGDAAPERTIGEPVTVRRIWSEYNALIQAACAKTGVPAEVVVAVIATESRGIVNAQLREPDGRVSSGVMQVLTATATDVLGRPVTAEDLHDPALSIEAGVGYIASQKSKTGFDPILVAAAYNAGGLYAPREQDHNRFKLRSTGDHLERMRLWYNDCVAVAKSDSWFTGVR